MKRKTIFIVSILLTMTILSACSNTKNQNSQSGNDTNTTQVQVENDGFTKLENDFSSVTFSGEDYFEEFLQSGGASSDADVVKYLSSKLEINGLSFSGNPFGCSTLSVKTNENEQVFGRNFDWEYCNALVVTSKPEIGFRSISTVNTDFISGIGFEKLPDDIKSLIAVYAPLDGMNEKGLAVSVNMISDSDTINQTSSKADITTTTAVRLLLNKAATTDEAVALLKEYDFHASMGYMVHLALADKSGKSVAVEYVGNEMSVIDTPILTNFYLTEGNKYGIGTQQSHTRFEILEERIKSEFKDENDVRDALSSVSKGNFGEFESTEWSAVFNLTTKEATYYHRENFNKAYHFTLD